MAVLRCWLERQISKTRFPSDLALPWFATVERVILVIAAQGQDRAGKIGVWIPKTKVGNVSSLCSQGVTGRSNNDTRAETEKKQLWEIQVVWKDKEFGVALGWIQKGLKWATD